MAVFTCKTALAAAAITLRLAVQAQPVIWPASQWPTSTPEEQGMDSARLAELVSWGAGNEMDSLVVVRHGKLVTEAYFAPFRAGMKHRINSATKAVVGGLVGIAQGKGLLGGAETPVLSLFTDRNVANPDERKNAVTLQHLLDMTSGLQWTEPLRDTLPETLFELERSRDWQQFVLDRPMAQPPGAGFNYNSGNSHLLSAILTRATGARTQDFAAQNLFTPLGITDWRWRADPQGISTGGWGLYLRTPDMARIGYLYLHQGEWNGQQVIPRQWVEKVFHASVPMNLTPLADWRYGDGWWTLPERKAYVAMGFNGQMILVMPALDMVVAITAHNQQDFGQLLTRIAASVRSGAALAPDAPGTAALARSIEQAAVEKPLPVPPAPPLAHAISGKTWRLQPNRLGLTEFTLNLEGTPSYRSTLTNSRGGVTRIDGLLGMDGVFAGEGELLVRAAWVEPDTLLLTARSVEEAEVTTMRYKFSGRSVEVRYSNSYGLRGVARGETD
ncbi:MAG: serine hydrolase [Ramlibacter sp.]